MIRKTHKSSIQRKIIFYFVLLFIFLYFSDYPRDLGKQFSVNSIFPDPKSSFIAHSSIYIDGNEALDVFCSGNGTDGTEINPHEIFNYLIDANYSGSGIIIRNTDRHLIISDVLVTNSGNSSDNFDSGIKLENATNVVITGSMFTNNGNGITLIESNNVTVSNNNASSNIGAFAVGYYGYGIFISNSIHNNIINNTFSANYRGGMCLWFSQTNNIYLNNFSLGNIFGIEFVESNFNNLSSNYFSDIRYGLDLWESDFNSFFNNTLKELYTAVRLKYHSIGNVFIENIISSSQHRNVVIGDGCTNTTFTLNLIQYSGMDGIFIESDNNTISYNNISFNNGVGIFVGYANYNNIYENNLSHNEKWGIELLRSHYNTIYHNLLDSNGNDCINLRGSSKENNIYGNYGCIFQVDVGLIIGIIFGCLGLIILIFFGFGYFKLQRKLKRMISDPIKDKMKKQEQKIIDLEKQLKDIKKNYFTLVDKPDEELGDK